MKRKRLNTERYGIARVRMWYGFELKVPVPKDQLASGEDLDVPLNTGIGELTVDNPAEIWHIRFRRLNADSNLYVFSGAFKEDSPRDATNEDWEQMDLLVKGHNGNVSETKETE